MHTLRYAFLLLAPLQSAVAQASPRVTFSTAQGSYVTASPLGEHITVCVATTLDSAHIRLNGTNVSSDFTQSTSGSCAIGTQYTETGTVPITFGYDSLAINACELESGLGHNDVCTLAWVTFRYSHAEVTPKGASVSGHVAESATQQFEVQNLLGSATTYNFAVLCSGSGVSGCSTTPASKIRIGANTTSPVTVNFTAGPLNSIGTIKLIATDSAQTAAVDTGSVTFTAQWTVPEVISTVYTNQEDQNLARCADNCFALTTALSTVPYVSRDVANGVTLVYNSDQMAVRPVLYADVKVPSNAYTLEGFQLSAEYYSGSNGWLHVTFLNGDQTLRFAAVSDTLVHRLAGQFDASSFPTNHGQVVYPLLMQIITTYADHADTLTDTTHHLALVNGRQSSVAQGWSIAGVGALNWCAGNTAGAPCQSYIMHEDGSGSVALTGPVFCQPSHCDWWPVSFGDFAYLYFDNQPYSQYKYPDSTQEIFSPAGYLTARIGLPSDTVTYGYDSQNRVISISDPYRMQPAPNNTLHTYWEINYGSNGISSIVEPDAAGHPGMGRTTTISVDANGLLRSWTDPDGVATTFGYDSHNRLNSLTDRKSNVTTYTYDPNSWKLVQITSPSVLIDNTGSGSPTSQSIVETLTPWQTIGVPITTTGGTPATPVLLSSVIAVDSTTAGKITFTADRWGQPLILTNVQGLATSFVYAPLTGLDSTITYPTGAVDRFTWNGAFLSSSTPAGQNQTQYGYCAYGQVCQINVVGGPSETFFVNANGHTDSATVDGTGSFSRYYGDAFGRDTLVLDAAHDTTKYRYDSGTGNLDSAIAWPSYRFTARTFDGHGRVHTTSVSTPNGPIVVTTVAYDSINRVVTSTDGLHTTPLKFAYDQLYDTSETDPLNQRYRSTYNALGWGVTETDTANRSISATYSSFGLPTTNTNRRVQRVQILYDSFGRVTSVTRPSSEPDNVDGFSYPDSGYNVVDSNAVVKDVTYSSRTTGLVDSIITTFRQNGQWFKRTYAHDALGRVAKVTTTTSDSSTITFNSRSTFYDGTSGLIDSLYIGSSANRLTFEYDSLGRLATVNYPSGVVRTDSYYSSGQLANTEWSGGVSIYRGYGYDSTGHVNEVDYTGLIKGDSLALYTYDVLGELVGRQLAVWTDNLTTCPGGQLQNGFGCRAGSSRSDSVLQSASYSYDAAGNLDTVKVGSTDSVAALLPGNRLTAWTGLAFTVDSDGNRTSSTVGSQTTTYAWGADGRLLSVTQGSTTRSYDYDPSGQLVQRKTNGTVDRYYLWDNGQILAILNGTASSRIAEFLYFGGADQPLARITGPSTSDTIHYYAQDGSGNVIAQFHGTTIEQNLAYDPWGAATTISPHGDTTQLRWKGLLYEDGITSLYYMRARWYDPATRRFVSADPIGLAAGVNQYAYAGGNPVSGTDPWGLKGCNLQYEEQINVGGDQWCQVLSYVWVNSAPLIPFDGTTSGVTQFGPSPLDVAGGGSGSQSGTSSRSLKPSPCVTAALANGALHIGVDAIGLMPEGAGVSRALGNAIGYRGIVATQQGAKLVKGIQGLGLVTGMLSTTAGLNETTGGGIASSTLGVAGIAVSFIEGATPIGQVIAGISIGIDIYNTYTAVAACNK